MVVKYGMDEELGQITYEKDKDASERQPYKPYSEKTAELIDSKVKNIIDNAYLESKSILLAHKDLMDKMADLLFEKEYLTKEEFEEIMNASDEETTTVINRLKGEHKDSLAMIEKKTTK